MSVFAQAGRGGLFAAICLASPVFLLSCASAPQTAAGEEFNKNWTLCVTAFDVSSLPAERRNIGASAQRNLAETLASLSFRARIPVEYAYYREAAWGKRRAEAAKKIADKQAERDALVFKGLAAYKLRAERKRLDGELAALRAAYQSVDTQAPAIVMNPLFSLTDENKGGTYPAPPEAGGEYYYCAVTKKADGFITAEVSDYHGRFKVTLRLYTLYTRGYSWQRSAVFAQEDLSDTLEELGISLLDEISQTDPAKIVMRTNASEATIVINERIAGHGETGLLETNPGPAAIEVYDPAHETFKTTVELASGEKTDISVALSRVPPVSFTVNAPAEEDARVYRGALYSGQAPLVIETTEGAAEYITVENGQGQFALRILKADAGEDFNVILKEAPEEGKVEKRRRQYYGANTRFWLSLPVTVVLFGLGEWYNNAYSNAAGTTKEDLYNTARAMNIARYSAVGLSVGFFLEAMVRSVFYISAASEQKSPVSPQAESEDEDGAEAEGEGEGEAAPDAPGGAGSEEAPPEPEPPAAVEESAP